MGPGSGGHRREAGLPENPWPALWALIIGFFMILVDATIVSIATPTLMRHFGAGIDQVLWVTSSYLLAYAVPLLVTGRLGDRIGPKNVYLIGLVVFTLSSLWCGLSSSIHMLIAARAVQGLGASMMTPQSMSVITRTFPPERRGGAMAMWGATAGIASLLGPILGGVLIDSLGWEWIFFVNVPVGVIGGILAWRNVPTLTTHAHSFDWVGVALSAVGLFSAVFAIQEGESHDWGTIYGPISVPLLLGIGVVALIAFVWWQSRVKSEPLVPLQLFRDRNFSVSNIAITCVGFTVTSMMFPFIIYAQQVRGLTPTMAALLLAPQSVMSVVLARPVGRLIDRYPPRLLASLGLAGWTVGILLLAWTMRPGSSVWAILGAAVVLGTASSFVWGPLSTAATRNLPPRMAGAGSGIYNTTRQFGSVIGSAAIAVMMQSRLAAHLGGGTGGHAPAGEGGAAMGGTLPPFLLEPFSQGLAEAMLLPAAVLGVAVLAALFYEQPRHLRKDTAPTA